MLKKSKINPFGPAAEKESGDYRIAKQPSLIDWLRDFPPAKKNGQKKDQFLQSFLDENKLRLWLGILILGLVILLGRIFYLQIIEGQHFKAIAEGNRIRIREIKAIRGVMYDCQHNLLVENIPSFSLAVIPVDLPKQPDKLAEIITHLAKVADKAEAEIRQLIESQPFYSYQPVVIKENLDFDQAILTKIESYNYPGVILKIDSSRQYLTTSEIFSFSHLLGYLGKMEPGDLDHYLNLGYSLDDYIGKTGLELSYESVLKGKNGKEYVEVDALGETKKILAYQEPVAGKNLILTIDSELQNQAEKSLKKILGSQGKKRGAVVVLNPNSGEILALVSLPAFDNNLFASGISPKDLTNLITNPDQPLFNRAISGEYPSGSIFKLIVAAAALQEGLITAKTSFNSVGGIAVDRWFFPDWKAGGHGWTNVTRAIAESINTFFYIIGGGYQDFDGLGVVKLKKYGEMFGLNQKLGIDLPNEAKGLLPMPEWKEKVKKENWYIGDTYHLAIGQGDILVTPLQVALWTSVFANGGTLYQPHLVKGISDINNNLEEIQPKVLRKNFIDPENIKIVNQGLRQAVLTGSAKELYNLPVSVAAKTGTAQWSTKKSPHAWITAFTPYQEPEIVVTVLIEEGGEGSKVALPVASEILNWWAENRSS